MNSNHLKLIIKESLLHALLGIKKRKVEPVSSDSSSYGMGGGYYPDDYYLDDYHDHHDHEDTIDNFDD